MILITQTDGRELRGQIEQEFDDELILKTEIGRVIVDKKDIVDRQKVLNCETFPLGTYIKADDAIYLKINDFQFRLVKNLGTPGVYIPAIDSDRIDFGEVMTHEEVFAPEEGIVLPEVPEEPEPSAEPEA